MSIQIPQNLQELQIRCQQISGKRIGSIAHELGQITPEQLLHAKGWQGQLVEQYLGASAKSHALPDFPHLGIELKTIPVNSKLKVLESTYVCTVQTNEMALDWKDSWVYHKLSHVLWVPLMGNSEDAIEDRIVLNPIFWQMDSSMESILRTDWEELMELLQLGYAKNLSAKFGTYLHIRPKAANNKTLNTYIDALGNHTKIVPKGFYLRSNFTQSILNSHKEML